MQNTSETNCDAIAARHISVLFNEVMEYLAIKPNGLYLDGTLGLGGHSGGILERGGKVLGLDRDLQALELARTRLSSFGASFTAMHSTFGECAEALDAHGWPMIDGALADLGVSSLQIDSPERGFSFNSDGPLDMRMNPTGGTESAETLVNRAPVARLKEIIDEYGEDPQAGKIARAIDSARSKAPIKTTAQLASIVEQAYPPAWRAKARNHPATRTFQALRMVVNGELNELKLFLENVVPRLKPGGRIAIISFHSLEDRIVKHFFKEAATDCICPPQLVRCNCGHKASLQIIIKKGVLPTDEEIRNNSRASSARLRVAEKII